MTRETLFPPSPLALSASLPLLFLELDKTAMGSGKRDTGKPTGRSASVKRLCLAIDLNFGKKSSMASNKKEKRTTVQARYSKLNTRHAEQTYNDMQKLSSMDLGSPAMVTRITSYEKKETLKSFSEICIYELD
nr:hypothetical protein L203_04987 [Cryptococcus depauperatus CBS 7841]